MEEIMLHTTNRNPPLVNSYNEQELEDRAALKSASSRNLYFPDTDMSFPIPPRLGLGLTSHRAFPRSNDASEDFSGVSNTESKYLCLSHKAPNARETRDSRDSRVLSSSLYPCNYADTVLKYTILN